MSISLRLLTGCLALFLSPFAAPLSFVQQGSFDALLLAGYAALRFGLLRVVPCVALLVTLAAMAVPRTYGSRSKAYLAAMNSDLKNLASR